MVAQKLVPNGVVSNDLPSSGWNTGYTLDAVLADGKIQTRARTVHSAPGTLSRLDMTTYTLQSNERVRRLRLGFILGQTHPLGVHTRINNHAQMTAGVWQPIAFITGAGRGTIGYGAWFERDKADSGEWTQAKLNALQTYIHWLNPGGSFDARLYESWIEVDVQPQPVAQALFPQNNASTESQDPRYIWSLYQDGVATQYSYELKVFTKAVVEGGGFDPNTSSTVYTETNITALQQSRIDRSLNPYLSYSGEYYWTVRGSVKFLGSLWWSEWATPAPFKLNDKPVANPTTPTGVLSNTNTPNLVTTYSDTELNAQTYSEFRVYKRPGGSWTGFDPDVSTAWAFRKVFNSAVLTTQCTAKLDDNSTYRFYSKVGHRLNNGQTLYSDWAFEDFTTDYVDPPAPTMVGIIIDTGIRLTVTPVAPSGGQPDIDYFRVERSLDGGTEWEIFRTGSMNTDGSATTSDLLPDTAIPFQVWDHEGHHLMEMKYRAFSVSTDLTPTGVQSVASNIVTLEITDPRVWVKDPLDSTRNRHFPVVDKWLSMSDRFARATKYAMGRQKPVVIRGEALAKSFTITFILLGGTIESELRLLLESQRTLFVPTSKGAWYVEVSGDLSTSAHLWDALRNEEDVWQLAVPFQEVDL